MLVKENFTRTGDVKDSGRTVYVPMGSDVSSDMNKTIGLPSLVW